MNFLASLHRERVTAELDKVPWKGTADANFSVHNAYKVLNPRTGSLFPAKVIWGSCVPSKATLSLRGKWVGESS